MGTFIGWIIVIYIVSCFMAFYAMSLAWIASNPGKDTLYDIYHGYKDMNVSITFVTFTPVINTFVSLTLWSLYAIGLILKRTINVSIKCDEDGDKEES